MKPFNNKTRVDPGRLRYTIKFYQQTTAPDGAGGTSVSDSTLVYTTKAMQQQISSYDQLAISAGASLLTKDCYFTIRKGSFTPEKDMVAEVKGDKYTIRAIIDLDQPQHYWKLLCIWQE